MDIGKKVRRRETRYTLESFGDYDTNVEEWYCFIHKSTFVPNPQTVEEIIRVQREHPTPAPPPMEAPVRVRGGEIYPPLSPVRRVRRRVEEGVEPLVVSKNINIYLQGC